MSSESQWTELSLGDVLELKRGYDLPKDKRRHGAVPIVSSSGISDCHSDAMVGGPGVVTGRYGTIGDVFFVEEDFWPLNTTLYVRDFKGNDPRFVSYLLKTIDFHAYSDKGAVPGLNRNHLHLAKVKIPAYSVQTQIAKILSAFDSQIELRRKCCASLEDIAQAIFKSWFVDFDPVKAKIAALQEGRDPLRAAMSAISGKSDDKLDARPKSEFEAIASTAALFPGDMQQVASTMIPVGWQMRRAGDVFELVYGKALKSTDRVEGEIPVYGSGGITGYHNLALVEHASVIVGRKGTVGALYWEDSPFFPIDTTFYVKPVAAPLTYCYYAMQRLGLDQMNTDAAVPGLNRENVYRLDMIWPGDALLTAFDTLISPMRKTIRALQMQSKTLASLRDALLPKLLSGEIAVKDSTDQVATAKDA